jgi:hypothetical protein
VGDGNYRPLIAGQFHGHSQVTVSWLMLVCCLSQTYKVGLLVSQGKDVKSFSWMSKSNVNNSSVTSGKSAILTSSWDLDRGEKRETARQSRCNPGDLEFICSSGPQL